MKLTKAEVNHLRLLLGWMRCSQGVFQSPEEIRETWKDLNAHGIAPSDDRDSRERLMQSYNLSADVPKYIRHALKMLTQALREHESHVGEIVDARPDNRVGRIDGSPKRLGET